MSTTQIIEVAVAALLIVGGIWLYRRGAREDSNHGSQGAVILMVIAALLLIHGLGLMEYRPTQAELNRRGAGGE